MPVAVQGDERRDSLRKASGRRQYPVDPLSVSEWKPTCHKTGIVGPVAGQTGRSETSQ